MRDNPDLAKAYAKKAKGVSKKLSKVARLKYKNRGEYVGQNFGSKGGLKHQNSLAKKRLANTLVWVHDSGVEVKTTCVQTLANVKIQLNDAVPNSVTHTSGLSEFIRRKAKKRYKWTLSKIRLDLIK